MPKKPKKIKLKTHRGAAKRFKRTKNGKFLRGKAFKQHILSSKTKQKNGEFEAMRKMDEASVTEFLEKWKPSK